MIRSTLSMAVLAALLSGCSGMLAPGYQRPAAPVTAQWPTGPAYGAPSAADDASAADIGWREFILDARLKKLVEIALANNRDLRISALDIEKARAQYGIARADLFPSISATANGDHAETATQLTTPGSARVTHTYTAGVGFSSYELDFFGRLQNLKDKALESFLQTEEARNAEQITLIAEVASAYLTLGADQERLRLSGETLASQEQTYSLTQSRFKLGIVSGLDVSQAQTSVESARADAASYTSQVAQDTNALALLLGAPVPQDLVPVGSLDSAALFKDVPVGLSSAVLQRRPDIRGDEHTLKSDNANIGAARAAFFPSITLTANAGSGSTDLGGLFKSGSGTWSFIPQLNLPIFEGGKLNANLDVAKTTRDIDVAQYEKDIQTAFKEVADALAVRGSIGRQLEAQQAEVDASAQYYRLASARYKNGIDSYMTMLDAQRSLYSAQQSLITVKLSAQSNRVTLYKVLGGGVHETHDDTAGD